jgi:hypothetical protein
MASHEAMKRSGELVGQVLQIAIREDESGMNEAEYAIDRYREHGGGAGRPARALLRAPRSARQLMAGPRLTRIPRK